MDKTFEDRNRKEVIGSQVTSQNEGISCDPTTNKNNEPVTASRTQDGHTNTISFHQQTATLLLLG